MGKGTPARKRIRPGKLSFPLFGRNRDLPCAVALLRETFRIALPLLLTVSRKFSFPRAPSTKAAKIRRLASSTFHENSGCHWRRAQTNRRSRQPHCLCQPVGSLGHGAQTGGQGADTLVMATVHSQLLPPQQLPQRGVHWEVDGVGRLVIGSRLAMAHLGGHLGGQVRRYKVPPRAALRNWIPRQMPRTARFRSKATSNSNRSMPSRSGQVSPHTEVTCSPYISGETSCPPVNRNPSQTSASWARFPPFPLSGKASREVPPPGSLPAYSRAASSSSPAPHPPAAQCQSAVSTFSSSILLRNPSVYRERAARHNRAAPLPSYLFDYSSV